MTQAILYKLCIQSKERKLFWEQKRNINIVLNDMNADFEYNYIIS